MSIYRWQVVAAPFLALALCRSGHATANCTYGPHEYKIVSAGMSPDHRFSIRAHGEGEGGYDNFHLYLFAEPAHKKIGPLEEVTDNLDTCADAIKAEWSRDSQHVSVSWRIAHHSDRIALYRIANRRAYPVAVPSVVDEAMKSLHASLKPFVGDNSDIHEFQWLTPTRFEVTEDSSAWVSDPKRYKDLAGSFFDNDGKPDPDSGKVVEEFGGMMTCELAAGDKCRVVSVHPGTL